MGKLLLHARPARSDAPRNLRWALMSCWREVREPGKGPAATVVQLAERRHQQEAAEEPDFPPANDHPPVSTGDDHPQN